MIVSNTRLNKMDILGYKENTKIFQTINPPPIMSLLDFMNTIKKILTGRKWIDKHLYVLEQRGESMENLGKGFNAQKRN